MKKFFCATLCIALVLAMTVSANATEFYGPGVTKTLATGTKSSTTADPKLTVSDFSIGGTGIFIFWIRDVATDTQVSPGYDIDCDGTKTIFYMKESREANLVQANRKYDARFKTNASVGKDDKSTISVTKFVP